LATLEPPPAGEAPPPAVPSESFALSDQPPAGPDLPGHIGPLSRSSATLSTALQTTT